MGFIASFILNVVRAALAIVLIAAVFLICANAFGRYVLLKPIIWAEEILGYALVWMVYLGGAIVTAERAHLRMDLMLSVLGPRGKAFLELVAALVFAVCGGLIIYQSYFSIQEFTHRSQVAELPMNFVHLVIPISFTLMVIGALALAFKDFTGSGTAEAGEAASKGSEAP